jgi:serine kinase of HPr protein (carbohydrate metabolism regulator)
MSAKTNLHATALVLGDRGVLITGPSGSGKTTLALTLIRESGARGQFARLVGDDQVFVESRGGRLVASCPETIAGLAEVFSTGPRSLPHLQSAVVDLVVKLAEAADAPRFSDPLTEPLEGVVLPRLDLPARNVAAASLAVAAWLGAPPFR